MVSIRFIMSLTDAMKSPSGGGWVGAVMMFDSPNQESFATSYHPECSSHSSLCILMFSGQLHQLMLSRYVSVASLAPMKQVDVIGAWILKVKPLSLTALVDGDTKLISAVWSNLHV
jgi:hypothetical protein